MKQNDAAQETNFVSYSVLPRIWNTLSQITDGNLQLHLLLWSWVDELITGHDKRWFVSAHFLILRWTIGCTNSMFYNKDLLTNVLCVSLEERETLILD